jgi:phage terminase large subunit-like protein
VWPPQWLTPVPQADLDNGEGELFADFAEAFGIITKDSVAGPAGQLLELRDWQKELYRHVFAGDGNGYKHRISLVGVPRKNGKSAMGSTWALASLILGARGAEVYSVAASKDQARIVFADAKRMVEASPELSGITKLYRDAIELPSTGSVYRVISAEAYSAEGLNPSATIFDELHAQPNRELFDVMSLAMGSRGRLSTLVAITTAGSKTDQTGSDSIAYSLYNYGKKIATQEIEDDTFFMAWWEAPPEADHRRRETWAMSNPGFNDLNSAEDFESAVRRTPEAEFKIKRTNQWVNTKNAWLPSGTWEGLEDTFELLPTDEYILGFDGSWKNDSTAVVAVIMPRKEGDVFRVFRVASWEKDFTVDDDSWIVDKGEVSKTIIDYFFANPNCREIVCDPAYWQDEMFQWADAGLQVVEYPNTISRTVPATAKLFEAIMNGKIRHDGDAALGRHLDNCILKIDNQRGARITKDYRNAKLKIDLAIALLMAYDRASGRLEEVLVPQVFV